MDAAAELGRNPVSKHQIQPEYGDEQAGGTGLPNPSRETKFSGANGDREIFIFPVQLTRSRIGNPQPYPVDPYPCYMWWPYNTPPRKTGEIPWVSTEFSPSICNEQADAGRDGRNRLARPNSLARTGTGKMNHFPSSTDHEQDWQPYQVDPYSAINYLGRPGSSEVPRNPLTRWDVSSIPANRIFLTKKLKNKNKNAQRVEND